MQQQIRTGPFPSSAKMLLPTLSLIQDSPTLPLVAVILSTEKFLSLSPILAVISFLSSKIVFNNILHFRFSFGLSLLIDEDSLITLTSLYIITCLFSLTSLQLSLISQ